MAGIKLSIPRIIFPSNSKDLCIGVCLDAYDADLIFNIEDSINNHSVHLSGFDNDTIIKIQTNIIQFLVCSELSNKNIRIDIKNIKSASILNQPLYLSFCMLYALNQYFKQVIEREEFELYCFEQGLFVKEALCAYHGGLLIYNGGKKGFIKVYTAEGICISPIQNIEIYFADLQKSGDLISALLAMDRSDFELMKSINSIYYPEESDNILMSIPNPEQNTIYKFTEINENSAFYRINRTGLEIA